MQENRFVTHGKCDIRAELLIKYMNDDDNNNKVNNDNKGNSDQGLHISLEFS